MARYTPRHAPRHAAPRSRTSLRSAVAQPVAAAGALSALVLTGGAAAVALENPASADQGVLTLDLATATVSAAEAHTASVDDVRLTADRSHANASLSLTQAKIEAAEKAKAEAEAKKKAEAKAKAEAEAKRQAVIDNARKDPRSAARVIMGEMGWSDSQWSCLDNLWQGESNWRYTAENPSSGAYGIPQSLPASKMGSVASDWRDNPVTQIRWGLQYIKSSYGSPCNAWGMWQSRYPHWY